jgi:hypothetical protein
MTFAERVAAVTDFDRTKPMLSLSRQSPTLSSRPRGVKYDKSVECLIKDRVALLASYDFLAEH